MIKDDLHKELNRNLSWRIFEIKDFFKSLYKSRQQPNIDKYNNPFFNCQDLFVYFNKLPVK